MAGLLFRGQSGRYWAALADNDVEELPQKVEDGRELNCKATGILEECDSR
jgi:hypothetical protein